MHTRRSFIYDTTAYATTGLLLNSLIGCKATKKLVIPADAAYNMKYLRGSVGFFTERGGTIGWYAHKDGIAVVDTQFPEQSQHLIEQLHTLQTSPIDALINTHHHGDHTAGNIAYKELTTRIIAHTNSKKNQAATAVKRGTEDQQLYPTEIFSDKLTVKVAAETIELSYYGAGHTDGDAIVHFTKANVVHMGDLIFNRRFPYIDKGAGASISNWVAILDKVDRNYEDDTLFIFGHSANGYDITGEKEDIKAFKNYLESLLVFGQSSIKAGKSLDEVKASTTEIPGAPEWQGKGISRSLDAVYKELQS